ncbi:hypothetical protein UVI_02045300 [Ustilaginoidea virens]|uniref:Uncharacterized protein n=1 Tax=Ustilaginoidea virens TaxID=1159556 RepID=A0A1B5KYU0_USTVR|nr:hypothetical protein UVI_02045300 [Ustilaginoidea virens]
MLEAEGPRGRSKGDWGFFVRVKPYGFVHGGVASAKGVGIRVLIAVWHLGKNRGGSWIDRGELGPGGALHETKKG